MKSLIAWLPGFIALFVMFFSSPERAFLSVYLPSLLLLPQIFEAKFKGFPDFSFAQSAIIPIFFFTLFTRWYRWRFSVMDLLIFAYIAICVYSEGVTSGWAQGRKLLTIMGTDVFFPYILAKLLIHPAGNSLAMGRRFVWLIFIDAFLSVYEMRFVSNPYIKYFKWFFPGQGLDWPVLFRYGLVRVSGPFIQPILFGIVIGIALLQHYWIARMKCWEKHFLYIPFRQPIRKQLVIFVILLFVLSMTVSRGPILSTFLGAIFLGVGFSRTKLKTFAFRFLVMAAVGFSAYQTYLSYVNLSKELAESEMIGNISYRGEMNVEYAELALKKPIWGWGATNWPKIPSIKSVDNHYLWLLLKHGLMGLGCFIILQTTIMLRLLYRGLTVPSKFVEDSAIAFTLLSCLVTMSVAILTVFMGRQIEPIFYILVGWADGFLCSRRGVSFDKDRVLQYFKRKGAEAAQRELA